MMIWVFIIVNKDLVLILESWKRQLCFKELISEMMMPKNVCVFLYLHPLIVEHPNREVEGFEMVYTSFKVAFTFSRIVMIQRQKIE